MTAPIHRGSDYRIMEQNNMYSRNLHIQKVCKTAGRTIFDHSLITEGDRVLAGLSGGKDSLSMIDFLSLWKARVPIHTELSAAYIEISELGQQLDVPALEQFCADRSVPFHHVVISVDLDKDPNVDKCFVCSWHRRKALFSLAQDLSFNKLALGHHLDDIIATLFMNMAYQANVSTMPVKVSLFGGKLDIIRPFGEIEEEAIVEYARLRDIPVQHAFCPYGKEQSRARMKEIISRLAGDNTRVRKNIYNSMKNIRTDYI